MHNRFCKSIEIKNIRIYFQQKKPRFMFIIWGIGLDAIVQREDGIYVFPITALKDK